ncbi:glycoside hydrolase family 3 C-terminal domain-containing protein [Hymenobacter sp. 15J16-1T3B]|uniref:glycoside hydrolase family 3 N-terminal domain-containing protein n=1 Tax=Hymenobacter sp. 15J16-1T3B TaxID=2886941 RepID=UPI001D117A44|nr:glycoside hydrolase family 3 N-terminal domain-containing protein [Hymenobacter sp. 15J16-1T3B]MCC3158549.1 glycoside hydrolase family 3 C-terminal domain-containing protein [Hymenobacter sp. 15J16-1T3B]
MHLSRIALLTLLSGGLALSAQAQKQKVKVKTKAGQAAPAAPSAADLDRRVEALLAQMTLEEKVGQMAQVTLDVVGKGKTRFASDEPFALDPAKLRDAVGKYKLGSILNAANNRARTPQVWEGIIQQIQDVATTETRLKIPVLYGIDAVHGETYTAGATMFPQQIAQAAARNRALVRRGAEITAYDTRASAIPWVFSPVLDLGSDPRSPRQWETYGEDPYLAAELGREVVKGYEGEQNTVNDQLHVAACIKHFMGYQVPQSGKDRTNAYIPLESLYEYHLPAFKAAIDAGAHSIMINSGMINGVPMHANYDILTKLLRERLGFQGLIVTDWGDIDNLYKRDHIVGNVKEAIALAINSGIDMGMLAYQYEEFCDNLAANVREGKVPQARVDDAVRRILRLKMQLGLFEQPVTRTKDYPKFGSPEHEKAAYDMAAEAITLLKNQNGILPLKKTSKVLLAGPNANSMRTLNGAWTYSWQGEKVEDFAAQYNTILESLQREIGAPNVRYVPGVSYNPKQDGKYYDETVDKLDEAVAAAKDVDAIILCLGENSYAEKPGDLNDMTISPLQIELAKRLAATGKPVVLVLNEGRPRVISAFEPQMAAVVHTYLPGNHGGEALADILFGDVNPSGKLPYNYPRYPNALVSYIHKYAEEQKRGDGVYNYEADYNPQWEFGHGLSYTSFKYANLELDRTSLTKDGQLTVKVQVTNTGPREGKEAVQLYSSDLVAAQIAPDVRRLRRFDKITLKPGETKTVTFTLPAQELSYTGRDGEKVLEAGEFEIRIGDQVKKVTLADSGSASAN